MSRLKLRPDGFPTRSDMLLFTPAERAIWDAVGIVEQAGCHEFLTEAVILLQKARDKVADFAELPDKQENVRWDGD